MQGCKLYHKTTWFETKALARKLSIIKVANYITKLRGLKPINAIRTLNARTAVANYITKLRGLKQIPVSDIKKA